MELYDRHAHADWHWFEEELSYDNARLSHALIVSGRATGQEAVLNRGLETLRWLTEQQTTEKGHLRPIGSNGFYRRGGARANFDQQPIEAQATVAACLEAYRATAICAGMNRRNTPSTGSSEATISASSSTCPRPAAAAMACM